MTLLDALNLSQKTSSTAVLQKQGARSIQAEAGKQTPKVSEIDFADKLAELNKLPLWDREWKIICLKKINNIPVTLDMKLKFLQPVYEQKLREAETFDDILKIFQQGAFQCFEGDVFNSQLFDSYIKPVIEQVAREREMTLTLRDITMVLGRSPSLLRGYLENLLRTQYEILLLDDVERYFSQTINVLFEMFYLWSVCVIHNTKELHDFCTGTLPVTKMKFDYEMGDADTVLLAEALGWKETLTNLDLSWPSKMGDAGAEAFAEALKVNTTLTSLNIMAYEIGNAGAAALAGALKVNKTLTTLNLFHSNIGDAGIVAFAEALEVNETLTSLHFWGARGDMRGEGIRALAKTLTVNKTLTSLNLDSVRTGTEDLEMLAEALKVNVTLASLSLKNSQINPKGAKVLAGVLKVNETLTSLDLEGNPIMPQGAIVLAEALEVNKALISLNLGNNSLGADSMILVGHSIPGRKSQFYSSLNDVKGFAVALAKALQENRTLTSLNLESNHIKDESIEVLAKALAVNGTLTSLNLKDNESGNVGAIALADALKVNRTLTSLNLERNKIGSIGVVMLAASRAESDTRTSFYFGNNNIANSPKQFLTEISTFYKGSTFQF